MSTFSGGFDDSHDEEFSASPLPPDDRLWRHPSELGASFSGGVQDAAAVRHRWLEHQPSRASAWTAGVVGAILATGLVALGTHLEGAFTGPPIDQSATVTETAPPATSELVAAGGARGPTIAGLGTDLTSRIQSIGRSMADIQVAHGSSTVHCLAMLVRSNGTLLAPASEVSGSTSLLVTLANGVQYVGTLAGMDPSSGLAIVRINGARSLPTINLAQASTSAGTMALAVTSAGGGTYSLGTIVSSNASPKIGTATLVNAMSTDLPQQSAPLGSTMVDAQGNVVGMVTGATASGVVATPLWLAMPVANELIATGHVVHGWLGMVAGRTAMNPTTASAAGVVIESVDRHSAAAEAGIRAGDMIVSLNGNSVHTLSALRGQLYVLAPGSTVQIGVIRHKTLLHLSFRLDDREPS